MKLEHEIESTGSLPEKWGEKVVSVATETAIPMQSGELGGACANLQEQKAWNISDADVDKIARVCHEANRAICVSNGDLTQPDWESAPEWQKISARKGVQFHIDNPYADSKRSHDEWMETKLRDGWRYAATKNPETKEHPCLLPYHALPEREKVKDDVFRGIIHGYLAALKRNAF